MSDGSSASEKRLDFEKQDFSLWDGMDQNHSQIKCSLNYWTFCGNGGLCRAQKGQTPQITSCFHITRGF